MWPLEQVPVKVDSGISCPSMFVVGVQCEGGLVLTGYYLPGLWFDV